MSSGLYSEKILIIEVCRFMVVTPICVTSEGNWPVARETRFCTLTAAMSALIPWRK